MSQSTPNPEGPHPFKHPERVSPTSRDSTPRPLALGGSDSEARFDLAELAAALPVISEAIASDRARYDLTPLAAALPAIGEAIAAAYRSASREAHRNGAFISQHLSRASGGGVDFYARNDRHLPFYEVKSHRRPGPPPALPGAQVPAPQPRPAPADRAA